MKEQFSRTANIYGEKAIEKLNNSHVAVFGVGGVGGYVVEALARSGIGKFTLVDNDTICESNLNRQIIATYDSIGKDKVTVMKERILSINPDAVVITKKCFFLPENQDDFDFSQYDYVVDAVDTVSAKIALVLKAQEANVPIIASMGAGNKIDPTQFVVTDIYKTEMDPLAKVMRRELKSRGIKHLKVVYSKEKPIVPVVSERKAPGSNAFVPSTCGLIIASEVIKDLTEFVIKK